MLDEKFHESRSAPISPERAPTAGVIEDAGVWADPLTVVSGHRRWVSDVAFER